MLLADLEEAPIVTEEEENPALHETNELSIDIEIGALSKSTEPLEVPIIPEEDGTFL